MAIAWPEETALAVPLLSKLIVGEQLTEDDWSEAKKAEGFVWRPVVPQSLQVGDVVRVRLDAYADSDRSAHNGRQGKVSAIRNGVYVLYDGGDPKVTQMGVRHDPRHIERRVRRQMI